MQIKRNNPGNIRFTPSVNWKGQVGNEGGFVRFDTLQNGYRAQLLLLNGYVKKGFNTLDKIITRYAPPTDNNPTRAYIGSYGVNFVSAGTSINPNAVIAVNDFDTLSKIGYQMSLFEHGVHEDDGTLQAAVTKAKNLFSDTVATVKANSGKSLLSLAALAVVIYFISKN